MQTEKVLERIGLTEKEIKVYLTLLRLGLSKANKISQESKIERRTCYETLNKLKQRKIVSIIIKNGIQNFKATNPKKILEELKETQRQYEQILPKLEELPSLQEEDIKIEILQGKEGLRTIFREIIKLKKEVLNFGGFTNYDKNDYILWEQLLRDMKRLKIKEKVLFTPEEKIIKIPTGKYKKLKSKQKIPTNAIIYENNVAIIIWSNKTYSIIKVTNKKFADSYKKYFEHFWKT